MDREPRTVRLGQLLPAIGVELDRIVRRLRVMEAIRSEGVGPVGDPRTQDFDPIVQTLEQLAICCTAAGREAGTVAVTDSCVSTLSLERLRRTLSGEPGVQSHPSGDTPAGEIEFF